MLETVLKYEEAVVFRLRALYKKYGYSQFKMSKFEEYDFYVRNKDFLISDRIITFNDTNGRLMALKPDVTLSIVKNAPALQGATQKLYYNENVYRVSDGTHTFREIMQSGLECIGDIDLYSECEVVSLALRSLSVISDGFVLALSHTGIAAGLLSESGLNAGACERVLACLGERNAHGIREVFSDAGGEEAACARLCALAQIYGRPAEAFAKLEPLCTDTMSNTALLELRAVCGALEAEGLCGHVRLDFSVANNMDYYSGLVFRGFVDGVPAGVLSGGRYDRLMQRLGKKAGAIGFAVYLDQIERLGGERPAYDVDTLLLYTEADSAAAVLEAVRRLSDAGKVFAARTVPEGLRYRRLLRLSGGRTQNVEHMD